MLALGLAVAGVAGGGGFLPAEVPYAAESDIRQAWFRVFPATVAIMVVSAALCQTALPLVEQRARGILQLLRGTPLRPGALLRAAFPLPIVVAVCAGALGLWGASLYVGWPSLAQVAIVTLSLSVTVCCSVSVAFALGARVRSEENVSFTSMVLIVGGYYLSGVLFPWPQGWELLSLTHPVGWLIWPLVEGMLGVPAPLPIWVYWGLALAAAALCVRIGLRRFVWEPRPDAVIGRPAAPAAR